LVEFNVTSSTAALNELFRKWIILKSYIIGK